jgi:hypothetical protein
MYPPLAATRTHEDRRVVSMTLKHAGFVCTPLLMLVPAMALGQSAYRPESSESHVSTIVLVILGIAVPIVGYFLFQSFKNKKAEAAPVSQPQARQPKAASFPSIQGYPPGSVFISYRRDDSADVTGRIHERLLRHFARDVVFKDVDSIPLGIDFRQHLEGALGQCRVLIGVIGDQWIERGIATGKRRIDDPRDQLRIELEVALSRNIPLVPVLVRKASVPSEEQLPSSLKSLAYRNGIQVRPDPDFNGDRDRLIKGIEPYLRR